MEQGISVARDLPPTGSEANTTICFFIDSHCPYLLSGETTFKLELVYLPVGKYCVYPRMVYR